MKEPELFQAIAAMEQRSEELASGKSIPLTSLLPAIRWNGTNNQYHHWMSGFINRTPLTSLIDGRDAWTKIGEALKLTLLINGLAFFLAVWLGILIGKWSALHDGTTFEKWTSIILFAFFAIPSFWLATLLIFFFSSGEWLSLFPTGGLGRIEHAENLFTRIGILLYHLILPVSCLALGVLAYVSRQMKQSVSHELTQPFVGALRTMGISEKTIVNKHVMRNAWFPLITMIGKSFPELISGSMIVEVIFSIPGMGRLMYTSLLARDWPVVFPILMLVATVTILAYTVADIIYKAVDPRVKTLE
jgi:peptide/nickel transport system permease protein